MIALWLVACLLTQTADAQSLDRGAPSAGVELEIPDVTLFGRDTVYLSVPAPRSVIELPRRSSHAALPEAARVLLPERLTPLRVPAPPRIVPVGGALAALRPGDSPGGGTAPLTEGGGPSGDPGAPGESPPTISAPAGARSWAAALRYVPTLGVSGTLGGSAVRGRWSGESLLSLALPDGWSDPAGGPPQGAGHVLFSARGARDGAVARFSAGLSGGALDPPLNPRTYTLGLSEELRAAGRVLEFSEAGALQLQSRAEPDVARAAAGRQSVSLRVHGQALGLSLEAAGATRLDSGAATPQTAGALTALASYRTGKGGLQVAAGASALYFEDRLTLHPALALELYPLPWLSLRGQASAFLDLAPQPELYAVHTPAGGPLLRLEGGYRVQSTLGADFTPRFEGGLSAWYLDGRVHRFVGDALSFDRAREAGGSVELAWRSRGWAALFARGSADWDLEPVPVLARKSASAWLQAGFSKAPVTLIMAVSWGDFAGQGEEPGLLSPWEIFSGLSGALQAAVRLRPDQALEAGLLLLVPEASATVEPRVFLGYSARLRAPVVDIRRR